MPGFCCLNLYKSSRPWKGGRGGEEEGEGRRKGSEEERRKRREKEKGEIGERHKVEKEISECVSTYVRIASPVKHKIGKNRSACVHLFCGLWC